MTPNEYIETIYHKNKNGLFVVAVRIVKNQEDAEDIVQLAITKALARLHKLDSSSPKWPRGKGWLFKVVINTALSSLRRKPPLPILFDPPDTKRSTIEDMIVEENKVELTQAIRKLTPKLKNAITMYCEQLKDGSRRPPTTEIAERFKISPNNAALRVSRAKKKLGVLLSA